MKRLTVYCTGQATASMDLDDALAKRKVEELEHMWSMGKEGTWQLPDFGPGDWPTRISFRAQSVVSVVMEDLVPGGEAEQEG